MKLKVRAELKDIVIFLIFCVVLLYLVAIAVINLNSFAVDGVFRGLNPIPAFTEFFLPTIVFYIAALVCLMLACSSYFFEMEEGIGVTTQKKSKNDGYSKLLSDSDMKKDRGIVKIHLKDENYEGGGIPFINNGVDAWVDNGGEPHALIMGASGSGKTQMLMFPLIKILARHGESLIVTDPKGELYEECGNLLKEKGYKVILINFRDPNEGAAWNPFSYPYRIYKEGNIDKANELLQDLASNILIDPNNKAEPFWEQTASNFFTGLALGLFDDASEDEVNINSINMMAEIGEDRIGSSNYIKEYFKSKGELSPAYIAASSCINAPNETRGGIMSTFRTKTRIFSSQESLSEMLSYSDFDIRDVGKEKTAVFLKVHDEKTTYHALATIFVKQAYEALIAVAQTCPNLKLPYRTNFILDEFANMPPIRDIGTMITASRSRNIRFSFAIQNFSQLNQVYGKEVAETIKGNCGNFVYIMSTELAALEEISKLLGDKKPDKAKKDEPAPPIRPLFTVSDLQALKENEVIFNRFRSMPYKTKLTPNWKIDWGKKYEQMTYTTRQKHDVKVFDLKKYVEKYKEEQGTSMPQMGMPGMMGGMPMMGMPNPFMPGPMPGGLRGGGMPTNLDDYVKRLDEKIAELEREEEEEKRLEEAKKLEAKVEEPTFEITKSEDDIKNEIEDIFTHKENRVELSKELDNHDNDDDSSNGGNNFMSTSTENDKLDDEIIEIKEDIKNDVTHDVYVPPVKVSAPEIKVNDTINTNIPTIEEIDSPDPLNISDVNISSNIRVDIPEVKVLDTTPIDIDSKSDNSNFEMFEVPEKEANVKVPEPIFVEHSNFSPIENIDESNNNLITNDNEINKNEKTEDFFDEFFGTEDE